eukprot:scaffold3548_cov79-Skeletonema_dohrnii-CCMP3373.AAC.2
MEARRRKIKTVTSHNSHHAEESISREDVHEKPLTVARYVLIVYMSRWYIRLRGVSALGLSSEGIQSDQDSREVHLISWKESLERILPI